jgi:hypothetical protein
VSRLLKNFRFVAETYGLIVPTSNTRRALVDLSILLAFWAASNHGVGSMYEAPLHHDKSRKRKRGKRSRRW